VRAIGWSGPGIMNDEWMVIGHSNGGKVRPYIHNPYLLIQLAGQGVWFLTTHYPDNVFAAAPVSGYTSIESKSLLSFANIIVIIIYIYMS
jgi:hypothetical protein